MDGCLINLKLWLIGGCSLDSLWTDDQYLTVCLPWVKDVAMNVVVQ